MSPGDFEEPAEAAAPLEPEAAATIPAPSPTPAVAQPNVPPPDSTPPPPHVPFEAFRLPLRPRLHERIIALATDHFLRRDPTFWSLLAPLLVVSLVLFTRWPGTNYIFDEQEALLANPYVNATGGLRFIDAIHRDFWGLPADRSVGSYRPIPDFFWRLLWHVSKQPFFHHIYNVFFHAINGAILGLCTFSWTKRRETAVLAAFLFVACAVLTEAVSGIVGIADVLGGMGALLALAALSLPGWAMPFAVFTAIVFGLFCKESALVCVPLVPFAALLVAPLTHPHRPARVLRTVLAAVATFGAFYLYVELRKRWFLSPLPSELSEPPPFEAGKLKRFAYDFLVWFHQAPLPKDPLNNPLASADTLHRIAGALRVYWRGLGQIVFPKTLSGDYSFPQEPIPDLTKRGEVVEILAGAAMMVLPPLVAVGLWLGALVRERRARKARVAPWTTPVQSTVESAYRRELDRDPRAPGGLDPRLEISKARWRSIAVGAALLLVCGLVVALDRHLHGYTITLPIEAFRLFKLLPIPAVTLRFPLLAAAIPVGLVGLGMVVEGQSRLVRPDPSGEAVPLARSGLILVALGFVWVVVSYFPHSNIPAVLPTVRAERFWYFPAIGTSMVLAVLFSWLLAAMRKVDARIVPVFIGLFFLFQGVMAYRHATNYRSDVDFWEATKDAVPNSAKAHLNYSVMKGARGDLETRLVESKKALELAPKWPMAFIYTGDTLCRLHRSGEAWPYYQKGFDEGPNELSLIALALGCLHDEKELMTHEDELRALAAAHEGSWIAYLAIDTLQNHEKNNGVDPKYKPRGYNEGPKE
ncbi:MAG: tetratricopeptide repeat protein [Byssovorax sp.]